MKGLVYGQDMDGDTWSVVSIEGEAGPLGGFIGEDLEFFSSMVCDTILLDNTDLPFFSVAEPTLIIPLEML